MCVYTSIHVHVNLHDMFRYICTQMHAYVHTNVDIFACTYIYSHAYGYIYMHMYTFLKPGLIAQINLKLTM